MNVAAYIRVSTDGQVCEDKFSPAAQAEQIEAYCASHDMTITKWYRDESETNAQEHPDFDEIVYGDCVNPPIEAVIVANSNRVTHDINVYYYYKMMLRKKDIKLISIAENFGQLGMFTNVLEAFTLCVAKMEKDNITKRTSSGRRVKASSGGYSGGRPPYGYEVHDGKLIVNHKEARVVQLIFKYRREKMTYNDIAAMLNTDDSIDTRYGKGNGFQPNTVRRIIERERLYRGDYQYADGDWVKGDHEAILTD